MGEVGDLRVFLNDFLYTSPTLSLAVRLVKFDIFSARCTFMWSVMWCVHVIHMSIYLSSIAA